MLLLILGGAVLIVILYYVLHKKSKLSLTDAEQKLINGLVTEEQKALAMFSAGKEEMLAEYEKLKAKVENAVGLHAKLPVSIPIPAVEPVIAPIPALIQPPPV